MFKIIITLFFSGLLFGSGPCVAACGPFLVSYIAGTGKGILKGLILYILFSLARVSIYLILGVAIFFLGRFALEGLLGNLSKFIFILGGIFIALVGLFMALGKNVGLFSKIGLLAKPDRACSKPKKNILEYDKKNIIIYGLIIGLAPCAPLLSVLAYIGLVSKSWPQSLFYSFSFGLGTFISPLILLAMLSGAIPKFLLNKKPVYYRVINFICGLIIMSLGLQLISRAL